MDAAARAARERFLTLLRQLSRAYQAFESYDARGLRQHGLTPAQGDVVFTLGNTPGMRCAELGEKTLITKGTLTGVLDRLESKGLISRRPSEEDRRSVVVALTPAGEDLFRRVFPAHVAYLGERLSKLSAGDRDRAIEVLAKIQEIFG